MTEEPQRKKKAIIRKILSEKAEKTESTQQLTKIVQSETAHEEDEIINLIGELEKEGKIRPIKKETVLPSTLRSHLFSKKANWYWITCIVALLTTISVFGISEESPLSFVRLTFGLIFALFLPGFAFIKMLFPQNLPIQTSNSNINNIERVALSIALSVVFTSFVGLILNYTPWGLTLAPLTLILLSLMIIVASVALIRQNSN